MRSTNSPIRLVSQALKGFVFCSVLICPDVKLLIIASFAGEKQSCCRSPSQWRTYYWHLSWKFIDWKYDMSTQRRWPISKSRIIVSDAQKMLSLSVSLFVVSSWLVRKETMLITFFYHLLSFISSSSYHLTLFTFFPACCVWIELVEVLNCCKAKDSPRMFTYFADFSEWLAPCSFLLINYLNRVCYLGHGILASMSL